MKVKEDIINKWKPLLEHEAFPKIKDSYRKAVTAVLLENQSVEQLQDPQTRQILMESGSVASNVSANFGGPVTSNTTNISGYDPILINLVRRSMPNMVAYDLCGVQPMTLPTGLIFALRSKTGGPTTPPNGFSSAPETFYNEVNSALSGAGTQSGRSPAQINAGQAYTYGTGQSTLSGETLGTAGNPFQEVGFTIEKVSVEAKTRALKAEYTAELAQDLKSVHGLDAEAELSNILQSEILAEINREVLRTIYVVAKEGAQNTDLTTAGKFDMQLDSNGRWAVEKFKGLLFQIDRECNQIARDTRRGKGNFIVCSSDVASALSLAGVLDYAPALSTGLDVDDTGNTFAGLLNGRIKVYIDPYAVADPATTALADAGFNFFVAGYRGASAFDAGIFYCPYVPLQLYKTIDSDTFQPKIAFRTRYGMVANPFAEGLNKGLGAMNASANVYYRRVQVLNLTGTAAGQV